MARFLIPLALAATLAGCAVGPDYRRPLLDASGGWREPMDQSAVDVRWWQRFDDPVLTSLIDKALQSAPDIAEAEARLAEARANRDAAAGGRLPSLVAKGSATQNRQTENGAIPVSKIPGFQRDYGLFDLGFDASWEIDLWGKRSREVEAATARVEGALAAKQDVTLMLIAEIARNYMELRNAQGDMARLQQTADADGETARLMTLRFEAGESSRLEADNAESAARASAAAVPQAAAGATAAAYRIAALAGQPPEAMAYLLEDAASLPASPESILAGIRSDLLERRPDVRRAERELAAATASIGAAKADLFPKFSLVGSIGQQSQASDMLLNGSSTRFSVGPSVSWPIFAGGTVRAQVRAAGARADAAAARYEKAVMGALADSETAANRFLNASRSASDAAVAMARAEAAYALSEHRFAQGEDDRLALMRARKTMLSARQLNDSAALAKAEAAIALYKALGGGWEAETP